MGPKSRASDLLVGVVTVTADEETAEIRVEKVLVVWNELAAWKHSLCRVNCSKG